MMVRTWNESWIGISVVGFAWSVIGLSISWLTVIVVSIGIVIQRKYNTSNINSFDLWVVAHFLEEYARYRSVSVHLIGIYQLSTYKMVASATRTRSPCIWCSTRRPECGHRCSWMWPKHQRSNASGSSWCPQFVHLAAPLASRTEWLQEKQK